jgi:streptogramin lyase
MVWVLDGEEGLLRLDPMTGERRAEPIPVRGITGSVFAGAEGIWVADRGDDTIVSVDPDTGQTLVIAQVRGTYLDLGFDQSAVWVLSRAEGSSGYLTPLDLLTGRPLSEPVKLEGQPVDVATGAGSVWVALREKGAVAKVDPIPLLEERSPSATP